MTWEQVAKVIPILLFVAGIVWGLIELRVRKLIEHSQDKLRAERKDVIDRNRVERMDEITEAKRVMEKRLDELADRLEEARREVEREVEDLRRELDPERRIENLRRELQGPIGNIGKEAMEANERIERLVPRVGDLETKMNVFWRAIERYGAKIFRGSGNS